jgi:hypothetical protein
MVGEAMDGVQQIRRALEELESHGAFEEMDLTDVGNAIGAAIGKLEAESIEDFQTGLEHGISLINGTHP